MSVIKGVLFDLDGVIVSTDEFHYKAWKAMADKEGIYFDWEINQRLRGVSRMESLDIVLEKSSRTYTQEEKEKLAQTKNIRYRSLIEKLTPMDVLPGAVGFIKGAKSEGLKTAIASSSRNTELILKKTGLLNSFDAVVSGNDITKSKPDPEVFLLAASRINTEPSHCLVVEDSYAGIDAAKAGKMKSLGVGYASGYKNADMHAESLSSISIAGILDGI